MKKTKIRIVALISGSGRTVVNINSMIDAGMLDAKIEKVISSRDDVLGVERCKDMGIPVEVVKSKDFFKNGKPEWSSMSEKINDLILPHNPDLVIMAGFMCFYEVPRKLEGKIMNIHPSLIPAFSGKGMWGHNVHEAVVKNGCKVTGCTVHFVDNKYDNGPIILQKTCSVLDTDSPEDVAAKVFELECKAYPEAIKLFLEQRLAIDGNIVRIRD